MFERDCFHRRERRWVSNGRTVAQLTLIVDIDCREPYPCLKISGFVCAQKIDCLVWLESVPMRFGGERWYALCPNTGKRCATLILPPGKTYFASVRSWGIPYRSQRENEVERAHRAIDKVSGRLRSLPKYARHKTRQHLIDKMVDKYSVIDGALDQLY